MKRLGRLIIAAGAILVSAASAFGQGAILQGGPWSPGHAPMYVGQSAGQAIVQDSGAAGGGPIGMGLAEQLLTVRNPLGVYPAANAGTGQLLTNFCDYDAPINNATGFHFLCSSPNAQGGGLIAYGFGGGATALPFQFYVNGTTYAFPFVVGGIVGPGTTVSGDVVCWNNTIGTLVKDCGAQITGPGTTVSGDYVCWNNTTGTLLKDCGTGAISGPGSSTVNHLAAWNNTSGNLLKDLPFTSNFQINGGSFDLANSISISGGVTAGGVGAFSGAVSGTTGTFSSTVSGTNGTFTGALTGQTEVLTNSSLTTLTMQDAFTSQDTLIEGIQASAVCDPGYVNGPPGSGPCGKFLVTPNAATAWGGATVEAINSRAILASIGGVINPEITCADTTGGFGIPIWGGGNQSGCGYTSQARIGSGVPSVFLMENLGHLSSSFTGSIASTTLTVTGTVVGTPLVVGETINGSGFTPTNTTKITAFGSGSGGAGTYTISPTVGTISSEGMGGGPSGAEGSMQVGVFGGSLDGFTQNVITFFNATTCTAWNINCSGTPALARLGEIAGNGMTPDGKFTQTETVSINFQADASCSGTFTDGSYTCPSDIVFRTAPNAAAPERNIAVMDPNSNIFLGSSGSSAFWANGGNSSHSGTNSIIMANGVACSSAVTGAGCLTVVSGALKYISPGGTVTTIANN